MPQASSLKMHNHQTKSSSDIVTADFSDTCFMADGFPGVV